MMTIQDYVQSLQVCRLQGMSGMEIIDKTISDMMLSPVMTFRHVDFPTIDVEDTVLQLYMMLRRLSVDFVPVVDPEDGSLVGVLGYNDILYLLNEAAKQHPQYFTQTVANIGVFTDIITAPKNAKLGDVLRVMDERNLVGIPVVDEISGQVLGVYHRNDVTFITRASDPNAAIASLNSMSMGEALNLPHQPLAAGETYIPKIHPTVRCTPRDKVGTLLNSLMLARTTIAVVVSDSNTCLGVVSVKDVLRFYFERNWG